MRTTVLSKALVIACAVALAGVAASTARAVPLASGTWQAFFFGATGSTATGSPFTFESSSAAVVTVTDAFCAGDRLAVSDGAAILGTTTAVAVDMTCSNPFESTPDAALANPGYSSGRFVVGTGTHSIGIVASTSPFGAGTAFIRYDVLTDAMCKSGGWMALQPSFKNQGDCVSFVATGGSNGPAG
jgi:hypothetical protein